MFGCHVDLPQVPSLFCHQLESCKNRIRVSLAVLVIVLIKQFLLKKNV